MSEKPIDPRCSKASDPRRRFTCLDGCLLVLCAGLSVSLVRSEMADKWEAMDSFAMLVVYLVASFSPPWAWAVWLARRIGPRPIRERGWPPPGDVACVAVMLSNSYWFAIWFVTNAVHLVRGRAVYIFNGHTITQWSEPTVAVATAWAILLFAGRWKPERDWVDRAGIAVGVYWLIAGFILNNWKLTWLFW